MQKRAGLFQATAWYGFGNLVVRFLGFLLLPLYSNLIPIEQFGIYSLLMSTYVIAGIFYQFGMNAALTNFYLKETDENKRKAIFSTVINTVLAISFILTIILALLSKYLSLLIIGISEYQNLFVFLFIALFFETTSTFILQLYKSLEQPKRVVFFLVAGAVLNFLLNIWFVYFERKGIEGIILSHFISSFVILFSLLPGIRHHYLFEIDNSFLKTLLIFSFPLFLSGLFSAGMDVADRYILNHFLGKKQVGEYSFAYRIAMVTNVFVISFRTAWIPHALNCYRENNYKEIFGMTFLKLLTAGIFILLFISFFAEDLFQINVGGRQLFNSEYKTGLVILPFVIVGYIFGSIAAFHSVYPFVNNKSYHFLASDGLGLTINLILNFILIPQLGIVGAGISTCVGFMFTASYLYLVSKNNIEIDYPKMQIIIVSLIGAAFLLVGLTFHNFILQTFLVLAFLVIMKLQLKLNLSNLFRFD